MKTNELGQTIPSIPSTQRAFRFFETYWVAFQARRKRKRAQADLYSLNDRELRDMGITRGEIDNVTSHFAVDPRR
ncbi:DUF1127 domain-containing protein [Bradyrhizobium sp. CB2312]|uniref:DUF1127 domain-containing protein n=1 Tax=Bradyrhizobium sp. CB2312 TaxID=3039155 RepID=UPI0032C2223A